MSTVEAKIKQPYLVRCIELTKRARFDLKLADDAASAACIPARQLARIRRARREMSDLLKEMEESTDE